MSTSLAFAPPADSLRTLDERSGDALTVTLLWRPLDDAVFVRVVDARSVSGDMFARVPADCARHAFQHPFAYSA